MDTIFTVKTGGEEQLLSLGRERGVVTFDEIAHAFPELEDDESLERILEWLVENGIEVIDSLDDDEPGEDEDTDDEELDPLEAIEVEDMVGLYLKEASSTPLLTAKEEVELAQRIERGERAARQLARNGKGRKQRAQLEAVVADGQAAREHLIAANTRLVISIAKKYIGHGLPFLDLIQEGNVGLIRAARKFNHRRGLKFSTYATWWIRQAVTRALADRSRTIRLPVHMSDQINRLVRVSGQLAQELGHEPSSADLAQKTGLPVGKVEHMLQMMRDPLSLDTPTRQDEESMLGDFIEDTETPAPPESVTRNMLQEQIQELLQWLPPREVRILQLRYGLGNSDVYTLEQVGKKLGITRERVRQIEMRAIERLRQSTYGTRLKDYCD